MVSVLAEITDHPWICEPEPETWRKPVEPEPPVYVTTKESSTLNVILFLARVSTPRCVYRIYEFMNNGSIEKMLRDIRKGQSVLDWPLKYKIAVGVVNGLVYLYYSVTANVIRRDLKPDNILLDQDMEVRIAVLGL
ncbi:leucine-rich repeat receptor-like serine/threonine/tyrosine-protein kinase SOBIR1 [Tanacetum coccineum]